MKHAVVALLAAVLVGACSGDSEPTGERLRIGDVVVDVQSGDDGRLQACVVSAKQFDLPSWPLCVGPHDGTPGPSHAWSSATRSGDDVLALVILGNGDEMADEWYTTAASVLHPVVVAAGVLRGYGGSIVCGTYVSSGSKYNFDTGVSVASPSGLATTDVVGCPGEDGPVRVRPWVVQRGPAAATDDTVVSAVSAAVSFYGDHGIAMEAEPLESVVHAGRAALLVDFPEAATPCAAVRHALAIPPRLRTVDIVFGGHISSTSPLRQLYGVSCDGRAEACSGDRGAMVLVDRSAAAEIDLAVVAAHEIGHVVGLRHPFETDCGGTAAREAAANLMALERDVPAQGYRTVTLTDLTLTDEQVRVANQG